MAHQVRVLLLLLVTVFVLVGEVAVAQDAAAERLPSVLDADPVEVLCDSVRCHRLRLFIHEQIPRVLVPQVLAQRLQDLCIYLYLLFTVAF